MASTETKLYVIATPLGNRMDITLRAIETLKAMDVIFAEDSREITKLLSLLEIGRAGKKIFSFAQHNMKQSVEEASQWLERGTSVGLVCDRGTPAISDPGAMLVRRAEELKIPVVPVPGPSSITTVLSVYGGKHDRFLFLGFLPQKGKARIEIFNLMRRTPFPSCFFESPNRICKTIGELAESFPEGEIFIGREMTKAFETFQRVRLSEVDPEGLVEKGEYTVVLDPGNECEDKTDSLLDGIELRLCSERDWSKKMAQRHNRSAKDIYNTLQQRKK